MKSLGFLSRVRSSAKSSPLSPRPVLIAGLLVGLCSVVGSARAERSSELPHCASHPACETIFLQGRRQSEQGNASAMHNLAVLFAMANCGLPATAGFVGEWMVILGAVKANFWIALLAATGLVSGAAYTLWMVKRVYFGAVGNDHVKELTDINSREFLMLALLAVAVLWMGVYPKPFTDVMQVSVSELLKHVAMSKLN